RRDRGLELVVEDDGLGVAWPLREGIGLSTTRARLAALDVTGSLQVEPREGGGTRVRMTVPRPPPGVSP
ncbi:MAG TPA: hypothetical protein VE173_16245, partial [Longimicrobiales bacterium]|nr:hypothetical protein [Longimicrobiales bacterium]